MSQNDLSIANQGFASFRSDLNSALQALGSTNSGTSAPSTTYANQLFYDTTNNILKIRNEDNDAFISLFTLDQTNDNIESLTINGALSAESLDLNGGELILDADNDTSITSDTDDQIDFRCGGVDRVIIGADGSFTSQPASGGTIVFNEASNDVDFRVESNDNTNMLVVDGGLNAVGIGGGVSTNYQLKVAKSDGSAQQLISAAANFNSTISFGDDSSNTSGEIIYAHNGDSMRFHTNGGERVRILSDGKVGISTSSPSDLLEIQGGSADGIRLSVSGQSYHHKIRTNGDGLVLSADDSDAGGTGADMRFHVKGSERMRIHSGGHITAGTTSFGNHFFVYEAPTGGNAVTKIRNSSSNSSNQVTLLLSINERNDTSSAFLQGNNGFSNFYLFANGTHSFTSDENRKKNIETTRDGYLEDLAKLRVVKYNWKEQEDGEDKELGLIAQEVEKVFPKLVMEDPNDASDTDETKFKMIKTSVLPMMLLKALQEANTKITALEARITALEGE